MADHEQWGQNRLTSLHSAGITTVKKKRRDEAVLHMCTPYIGSQNSQDRSNTYTCKVTNACLLLTHSRSTADSLAFLFDSTHM